MHRLVCAFVIRKPQRHVFLCQSPYDLSSGSDISHCNKKKLTTSNLHLLFMLQSDAQNNAIYIWQNLDVFMLKRISK